MSARDQKLDLLAGVPLFGQLGKRELQRVGQLADVLDLPAGRTLMRQGERGAEAMVIVEGRANVERDGRLLYEAGPSDVLGEMALLSNRPRIATVTLLTDTRLLVLARREFDALMTEMPSVRAQIMENLALRLMAAEDSATH
jgi:CRP-like cAMP-binding protein